jgi:hypothetical protein
VEQLTALAAALEHSPLGQWARGSPIGYPLANLVHLLGLVMLVGAVGVLDLRLVGFFRALPAAALSRALIPLAATGILLLLPSGFVMFSADAGPLLKSDLFLWKLGLIAAAFVNLVGFHLLWNRHVDDWDRRATGAGRAMALASLSLWLGAAALGRLIAYS